MFMIRDRFMSDSRYKWQWLKSSGDGAFSANPDGAGGIDDVDVFLDREKVSRADGLKCQVGLLP